MKDNLVYVLAKIQFGQITESKFKESADALQEALRKDYPIVNANNNIMSFQFDVSNPSEHKVNQVAEKIINISSAKREWGIRITRDFLFIQTRAYVGFDDFNQRLRFVLDIVSSELNIYHTSFMGMRFINKFKHNPETDFKDIFLKKEFLQPDITVNGMKKNGSNHYASYSNDKYWVAVNSGISISGTKIPQDFADLPLDLGMQMGEIMEGVWAHLDIDTSYNNLDGMDEFSLDAILSKYSDLRSISNQIFGAIISSTTSV